MVSAISQVIPYRDHRFESIDRKKEYEALQFCSLFVRENHKRIIDWIHRCYLHSLIRKELWITFKNEKQIIQRDAQPIDSPLALFKRIYAMPPSSSREKHLVNFIQFTSNPSRLLSFVVRRQFDIGKIAALFADGDFKSCANLYSAKGEALSSFYLISWIILKIFQQHVPLNPSFRKRVADALEEHPKSAIIALKITSETYCKKLSGKGPSTNQLDEWQKDFSHHYAATQLCFAQNVPLRDFRDFFFDACTLDDRSRDKIQCHLYGI